MAISLDALPLIRPRSDTIAAARSSRWHAYTAVIAAALLTLAQQNRASDHERRRLAWLLAATGGFFLMNFALFLTEYSQREAMHGATYYYVTAAAYPFALATLGRAIKLRWAATA